jgi:hypothetical protein
MAIGLGAAEQQRRAWPFLAREASHRRDGLTVIAARSTVAMGSSLSDLAPVPP